MTEEEKLRRAAELRETMRKAREMYAGMTPADREAYDAKLDEEEPCLAASLEEQERIGD